MLMKAKTTRGTVLNVWVHRDSASAYQFCSITAYSKDNPGLPLDYMRLGEIHKDQVARLVESGGTISL